jgi:hypothetical protein
MNSLDQYQNHGGIYTNLARSHFLKCSSLFEEELIEALKQPNLALMEAEI